MYAGRGEGFKCFFLHNCSTQFVFRINIGPVFRTIFFFIFQDTVTHASLCCPVCRARMSSWCRRATRADSLVSEPLWTFLQDRFGPQVQLRQAGGGSQSLVADPSVSGVYHHHQLAGRGEIRSEFEALLEKERRDREQRAKEEEEQSLALIKRLQEEELDAESTSFHSDPPAKNGISGNLEMADLAMTNNDLSLDPRLVEEQQRIVDQLEQERSDGHVAKRLQRAMDQEGRTVVRKKGTEGAYQLREATPNKRKRADSGCVISTTKRATNR